MCKLVHNRWGIHAHNVPIDNRLLNLALSMGGDCYLVIDGAWGAIPKIREAKPDAIIVNRHAVANWLEMKPEEWADEMANLFRQQQQYTKHVELECEPDIFPNFPGWGQPIVDRLKFAADWNIRVAHRLRELCPGVIIHSPPLAHERLDLPQWFEIWKPVLDACDVLDMHCFPNDTPVMLADGQRRPIQEIRMGEEVMTHNGQSGQVNHCFERPYEGDLIEIKVSGIPAIKATLNHPLWTVKKDAAKRIWQHNKIPSWISASEAKKGDYLVYPRRLGLPCTPFTNDQLWVMGLFLAEGSCLSRGISFALHEDEKYLAERAGQILHKWFGNAWRVYHKKDYACIELQFYSVEAKRLFEKLLGRRAIQKKLAPELYNRGGLLPLVKGLMDGDGCIQQRDARLILSTASESLAWQIRQILLDEGIYATITTHKRSSAGLAKQQIKITCPHWLVTITHEYLARLGCAPGIVKRTLRHVIKTPGYYLAPIRRICRRPYRGKVFNLSVGSEPTYVAAGIAVHNCYWEKDGQYFRPGLYDPAESLYRAFRYRLVHNFLESRDYHVPMMVTECGNFAPDRPDYADELIYYFGQLERDAAYMIGGCVFILKSDQANWVNDLTRQSNIESFFKKIGDAPKKESPYPKKELEPQPDTSWAKVPEAVHRWYRLLADESFRHWPDQLIPFKGVELHGDRIGAAIIQLESGGDPNAKSAKPALIYNVIPYHAWGLMQVICRVPNHPSFANRPTAEELLIPAVNIKWGMAIFQGSFAGTKGNLWEALRRYSGYASAEYTMADFWANYGAKFKSKYQEWFGIAIPEPEYDELAICAEHLGKAKRGLEGAANIIATTLKGMEE